MISRAACGSYSGSEREGGEREREHAASGQAASGDSDHQLQAPLEPELGRLRSLAEDRRERHSDESGTFLRHCLCRAATGRAHATPAPVPRARFAQSPWRAACEVPLAETHDPPENKTSLVRGSFSRRCLRISQSWSPTWHATGFVTLTPHQSSSASRATRRCEFYAVSQRTTVKPLLALLLRPRR